MPDKDGNLTRKEQERMAETIELMKSGDIPIPGSDVIPFHGRAEETTEEPVLRKLPARPASPPAELPFYESITKMASEELGISVRVWRMVPEIPEGPDAVVIAAMKGFTTDDNLVTMFMKLSAIEGISAAEVLDKNSMGCIVYFDW